MRRKSCLTSDDIEKISRAAKAKAWHEGWKVTIAIVDDGGHLLYLERLDGAKVSTVEVATGKARTASFTRNSTKSLEDRLGSRPSLLKLDNMPMQGGLPLFDGEECVGGVGVSGVESQQDEEVARAAIEALA